MEDIGLLLSIARVPSRRGRVVLPRGRRSRLLNGVLQLLLQASREARSPTLEAFRYRTYSNAKGEAAMAASDDEM